MRGYRAYLPPEWNNWCWEARLFYAACMPLIAMVLAMLKHSIGRLLGLAILVAVIPLSSHAQGTNQPPYNPSGSMVQGYNVPINYSNGLPCTASNPCPWLGGSGSSGGSGGAITAPSGSYSPGALVDGASVNLGSLGDAAYGGTGNASITAALKGIYVNTASNATAAQRAKAYPLMTASTSSGAVTPDGGGYSLSVNGTFGGSTVTISQTYNGMTSTLGTYTAPLATPLQLNVYQGTTITATTSGGTSPSVNVTLAGGPAAASQANTTQAVTSFQQTTTTSAAALPSNTYTNGVVLTASSTNAAAVCVGGSGVTTANGYCLKPGVSISYGVANSNQIYIVGANTSDVLSGTGN